MVRGGALCGGGFLRSHLEFLPLLLLLLLPHGPLLRKGVRNRRGRDSDRARDIDIDREIERTARKRRMEKRRRGRKSESRRSCLVLLLFPHTDFVLVALLPDLPLRILRVRAVV